MNYSTEQNLSTVSHGLKEKTRNSLVESDVHLISLPELHVLTSSICRYHLFHPLEKTYPPEFHMILINVINYFMVIEVCYIRKMEPIILCPCLASEIYPDIGIWLK